MTELRIKAVQSLFTMKKCLRGRPFRPSIVQIVLALGLVFGLLSAIPSPPTQPTTPKAELRHFALASAPTVPFTQGELWSGGSPAEHCPACNENPNTAGSGSIPSVNPDENVSPATGDLTESYTPFSIPQLGGPLGITLTYDSESSQSPSILPGFSSEYGFGWHSNLDTSVVAGFAYVVVTEENGSQVTFIVPTAGSCPTGMQNDTLAGSTNTWCGANRIDARFANTFFGYTFSVTIPAFPYIHSGVSVHLRRSGFRRPHSGRR